MGRGFQHLPVVALWTPFGHSHSDPMPHRDSCGLAHRKASIFMPSLNQDICFAPNHITATTTWAEVAKRWFFHSLFHLPHPRHLVMNMTVLAQLGQFLEETHGFLLGKEFLLKSTLFVWIVLSAIYFLIAKAFQMRLDLSIVGFSGVLFGLLMIKLYFVHRGEVAWKWLISKDLLYAFTAPMLIDALTGTSTSHLAHASGIFGGLIYLTIWHMFSSRPSKPQEETKEVQPQGEEKEKEHKTRPRATERRQQALPASFERRRALRPKFTLPALTHRSERPGLGIIIFLVADSASASSAGLPPCRPPLLYTWIEIAESRGVVTL